MTFGSVRAVARIGRVVVRRRWRVRWWPRPRDEGQRKIQGRDMMMAGKRVVEGVDS